MGGLALRELCVSFRLHYRSSYRLSTFWCFDTKTIISLSLSSLSLSTVFGLIVSKCYLSRYPTLSRTKLILILPHIPGCSVSSKTPHSPFLIVPIVFTGCTCIAIYAIHRLIFTTATLLLTVATTIRSSYFY